MKVQVEGLVKTFGKTKAVDNASFDFSAGETVGFIGPNGAGKTTTIKMMATLLEPDDGDIRFNGMSAFEEPEEVRRLVGYMPDSLPEHGDITVWEYLDFFARSYGLKGAKRRQTLDSIEEFVGLRDMRDKYLKALSKGMKQRVSLGRALVHDPAVLILDEPAAGLDPRARVELRELIKILSGQGKAIFVSSHILSELEDICHRAVIIEKGRILHSGAARRERTDGMNGSRITGVFIRAAMPEADLLRMVLESPGVIKAAEAPKGELLVEIEGGDAEAAGLLRRLIEGGCPVNEFRRQDAGLEELFLSVTKGDLQ